MLTSSPSTATMARERSCPNGPVPASTIPTRRSVLPPKAAPSTRIRSMGRMNTKKILLRSRSNRRTLFAPIISAFTGTPTCAGQVTQTTDEPSVRGKQTQERQNSTHLRHREETAPQKTQHQSYHCREIGRLLLRACRSSDYSQYPHGGKDDGYDEHRRPQGITPVRSQEKGGSHHQDSHASYAQSEGSQGLAGHD